MGGGLLQLVAYGAQDVYLTGNPQITFFKVVYRRHTNFSIESIIQSPNGTAGFGNRITCQISRNGDLLHKLMLEVELQLKSLDSDGTNPGKDMIIQPWIGYRLLKSVEIEIGGQRIDKQYGQWMYIWNELTCPDEKYKGLSRMVGGVNNCYNNKPVLYSGTTTTSIVSTGNRILKLKIPLEFWFCRNIGLALPLIALQYHEVKVNIEFGSMNELFIKHSVTDVILCNKIDNSNTITPDKSTTTSDELIKLEDVKLYADYIFLDTDERRRFAQLSHEYLIEQVQFTGTESIVKSDGDTIKQIKLNFNHPVKELIWVIKNEDKAKTLWNNFVIPSGNKVDGFVTMNGSNITKKGKIMLNGSDRFSERNGDYFSQIQPFQHHTNIPKYNPGINVYSFALKPEEHQPSGTLNMSRIDTAQLGLSSIEDGKLYVYGTNYNVLRILSGMGGLAYSN
jgi:hypothetical protein